MVERAPGEVSLPVTVEFEDVDSYRIAHHSRYVLYLERARLRLLRALGIDLADHGLAPVVYDLQLRFRKPARLLDELEVQVRVRDFDDYQVTLGYRIVRGGETLVRATTVIAFADLDSGELAPMPDELARALG